MNVGVLALQGDVREHAQLLKDLGASVVPVRTAEDLDRVPALVLPGGESTTIGFMLGEHEMIEPLRKRIEDGMPVLGTCAGAILLARTVVGGPMEDKWPKIGVLDATIHRNAYGRQVDSFEDDVDVEGVGSVHAVFIRAPVIEAVGPDVRVLAESRGGPVVIREGNVIAATFHPELAGESGLHRLLLEASE
ncbi:MAG TPA: pyridoxal 5'-phosphate synthase glutaminase subunit PdxT [Actinomycetota bacterium]|nr:pyridoxal 5'-phosphate synthase glutaminase subunit PdxT [Actinomycetota bacterium]